MSFQLPVTLAAIHMLFCAVIPFFLLQTGLSQEKAPESLTRTQRKREWVLALVWALHIAMSNIGLRSVSVHLFVLVKCAGPVASALLSLLILGRRTSWRSGVALSLLVLGPALAVHAEVDVTAFGVVATVAVVVLTSLKVTLSTLLFSSNINWDSLALLSEMSPKACLLLLPWSFYEIFSNDAAYQMGHLGWRMVFLLCASGVFAFLLNYNNFLIFRYMNSPVAVAVFTNIRKVLTIAFSVVVFEHNVGFVNMAGMLVTFLGVALYTFQELQEKARARRKQAKLEMV